MPGPLTVPLGTQVSLGIGKETTTGTFTTPTIWHAVNSFTPKSSNKNIPRLGARKRYGQSEPITGPYDLSASLDVEPDPDTIAQLWAYGLGNQGTPTHNVVNTTLSASTLVGATSFTCASINGLQIGATISIDTSTNLETLVVSNIVPGGFTTTAGATKAHTSGVVITLTSATAYLSAMKFGALPSFSMEVDMQTDVIQYKGMFVDGFTIDVDPAAALKTTFNLVGITEGIKGSAATTPAYSVLKPFSASSANSNVLIASVSSGAIGEVGVMKMSFTVANNLKKGYYSVGGGRYPLTFPQLQRKVTCSLDLGFETDAAYRAFLGGSGATSPQSDVPGIAINALIPASQASVADATLGLQYAMNVVIANAKVMDYTPKISPSDMITVSVTLEASESGNGNNDDIALYVTNAASAVY